MAPVRTRSEKPSAETATELLHAPPSDWPFFLCLGIIGATYVGLIVWMLLADAAHSSVSDVTAALANPDIRYSILLSLASCTLTAILSVVAAAPIGYVLSRFLAPVHPVLIHRHGPLSWSKPGSIFLRTVGHLVDTILDIPIVLPPLVIGLSLLILFQTSAGKFLESCFSRFAPPLVAYFFLPAAVLSSLVVSAGALATAGKGILGSVVCWGLFILAVAAAGVTVRFYPATRDYLFAALSRGITYEIPAVILAQFMVAAAFAVRTMRVTFDQIHPRREQVALTLGCSRGQAFRHVVLPEAYRGMLAAGTLAWARALGEFGPILVFAGATRHRTEVLSTSVFLELSIGRLEAAVAVSLIMVAAAMFVLILTRTFGLRDIIRHGGPA